MFSPTANLCPTLFASFQSIDARQVLVKGIFGLWTGEFLVIAIWPCHSEPLGEESEAAGLFSSK
jgi:hypothetical protein